MQVPAYRFTLLSVAASCIAFGAMHSTQFIAATLAGLAYAFTMLHRGRIGDAAVAHMTTNALLAAWVLATGEFSRW